VALGEFAGMLAGCAVVLRSLGVFEQSFSGICWLAVFGFSLRVLFACLWRIPAWLGHSLARNGRHRPFLGATAGATANVLVFGSYLIFLGMVLEALPVMVGGSPPQTCGRPSPS
jgi:hypothetical protein